MMAICFVLLIADGGVNFLYCSNNSVAATTFFILLWNYRDLPVGGIEAEGTKDAVSSGTWNVKFQEAIVVPHPPHGE